MRKGFRRCYSSRYYRERAYSCADGFLYHVRIKFNGFAKIVIHGRNGSLKVCDAVAARTCLSYASPVGHVIPYGQTPVVGLARMLNGIFFLSNIFGGGLAIGWRSFTMFVLFFTNGVSRGGPPSFLAGKGEDNRARVFCILFIRRFERGLRYERASNGR